MKERKRKSKKRRNASEGKIIKIPSRVLSESEFARLVDRIKSGKIRPANAEDLRRRQTKIKSTHSFGMAQRMRTHEEEFCRSKTCIPTYIVDVQSEECKVIYLSLEQSARIRELRASIQRPIETVKPITTDDGEKKSKEGGNNK